MATDPAQARRDHPGRWPWRVAAKPRRPVHLALLVLICAGLVAYAWVDAGAAPFTRGALVGVVVPGALLSLIAVGRPPERIPPPDELDIRGMSYWLIALAAFFEWEASAWRDNSWPWHPSFTNLLLPLLEPHLVKTAAIMVWLLAGWALVRR
jgi:hypothetical protein